MASGRAGSLAITVTLNWKQAADRFGVAPRTIEQYLDTWPGAAQPTGRRA